MITEDYCSFEVSKLLKEKGFEGECIAYYSKYKDNNLTLYRWRNRQTYVNIKNDSYTLVPTHQMAMKWLREKKIFINVWYDKTDFSAEYVNGYFNYIGNFDSYEEAVEQSIKYVLEHVI